MTPHPDQNAQQPLSPSRPLDAATVIVVRDSAERPFELFLMRRHREQSFMGGAHVFPGGRLDRADCSPELAGFANTDTVESVRRCFPVPPLSVDTVRGLMLCAVRELFEEAGVLLARDPQGRLLDLSSPGTASRFASHRSRLNRDETNLVDLASAEHLVYAIDLLVPFAHWITPERLEKKRYDARFFVTRLPDGQRAEHDSVELTESVWVTPSRALDLHERRELLLMPPTLKTVQELTAFDSIEALLASAGRRPILPVLPQPFSDETGSGVLLPHDPEYSIDAYRQAPRPGEPSRVIARDGIWQVAPAANEDEQP